MNATANTTTQHSTPQHGTPQHSMPVDDVRGVLIQIVGAQLLLPNASTVEVMSYAEPEPVEHAPDWLLGHIRWRGWKVPMLAFSRLVGVGSESSTVGTKVVVLKALGGDPKLPYFSIVAQGFPRLVTIARDSLIVDTEHHEELPASVRTRVMFNDYTALVPDLDATERMILEVLRPVVVDEVDADAAADEVDAEDSDA